MPTRRHKEKIPKRAEVPAPKEFYDRQPEEPPRAWEGFCTYRDMGTRRSTAKVAQTLGLTKTQTDTWSSRYRWVERVALWQRHQDDLAADARVEAMREMNKRHTSLAMMMQKKLYDRLKDMNASELTTKEMAQWLKVATELDRLVNGAPTHNVSVGGTSGPVALQNNVTVHMSPDDRAREIRKLSERLEICGHD